MERIGKFIVGYREGVEVIVKAGKTDYIPRGGPQPVCDVYVVTGTIAVLCIYDDTSKGIAQLPQQLSVLCFHDAVMTLTS